MKTVADKFVLHISILGHSPKISYILLVISCNVEWFSTSILNYFLHFQGAGNPSGSTQGPQGFYPGAIPHGYHQPFTPLQPGVLGHGPPQGKYGISANFPCYYSFNVYCKLLLKCIFCYSSGHSPPPHTYHKDERSQRQFHKLKRKLEQKQMRDHPLNTTPPLSPRKGKAGACWKRKMYGK